MPDQIKVSAALAERHSELPAVYRVLASTIMFDEGLLRACIGREVKEAHVIERAASEALRSLPITGRVGSRYWTVLEPYRTELVQGPGDEDGEETRMRLRLCEELCSRAATSHLPRTDDLLELVNQLLRVDEDLALEVASVVLLSAVTHGHIGTLHLLERTISRATNQGATTEQSPSWLAALHSVQRLIEEADQAHLRHGAARTLDDDLESIAFDHTTDVEEAFDAVLACLAGTEGEHADPVARWQRIVNEQLHPRVALLTPTLMRSDPHMAEVASTVVESVRKHASAYRRQYLRRLGISPARFGTQFADADDIAGEALLAIAMSPGGMAADSKYLLGRQIRRTTARQTKLAIDRSSGDVLLRRPSRAISELLRTAA